MRPVRGLRLTLVSEESSAAYSGMLPGLIAGHYDFDETHIDLRALAEFADARFVRAKIVGLHPERRQVLLEGRPPLSYKICSLNIGGMPGTIAGTHAVAVKPVPRLLSWLSDFERKSKPARLAVIGAGAGGVELALALAYRFRDRDAVSLSLLERAADILPGFPAAARRAMRRALANAGVAIHPGVTLGEESCPDFDQAILATGVRPAPWLADSGVTLDPAGFVAVDKHLRSLSHPDVFAAGDVAAQTDFERQKAGVYAVRQGPVLAENLRRLVLGKPLESYRPQSRYLTLLSQGRRRAIAVRNGVTLSGDWVWRWKDSIDRRFMRRFTDLPVMANNHARPWAGRGEDSIEPDRGSVPTMRCAGCGAKVPGPALDDALSRLRRRTGAGLVAEPSRRDDAHVSLPPRGHEIIQSIDFFPALISDPFVFGQIATAHALSDLYAMGAAPLHALANVVLPVGSEEIQQEDLFQLLSGALEVLEEDGAVLAGGHSSEGETLGLGFAVTGHLPAGTAISKRGLRAGDALILTKPIGTGVLFAAAMRGTAKGRWIDAAIRTMRRSNRTAAEVLRRHGVTAMSDVTGFGLGGHMAEMLADSELAARLHIPAVPLLDGVGALLDAGLESTLAEANLRLIESAVDGEAAERGGLRILTDPQTSGGLLAGVAAENAAACIADLRESGDPEAAVIGFMAERRAGERPINLSAEVGEKRRPAPEAYVETAAQ